MAAGRVMGLDVGDRRIGIALSDPLGITAQPLEVLIRSSRKTDLDRLAELIRLHQVRTVVVGLPRQLNGEIGPQGEKVLEWVARFREAVGIPVVTLDERLSTRESERILLQADLSRGKRRRVVDKLAAALILERYLRAPHDIADPEDCS